MKFKLNRPRDGITVYGLFWFLIPMRLLCWLSNGIIVYLEDFRGGITRTIAWKQNNNSFESAVYPHEMVGLITLLPDGTVIRDNTVSYNNYWLPENKDFRVEMILKGAKNFNLNKR